MKDKKKAPVRRAFAPIRLLPAICMLVMLNACVTYSLGTFKYVHADKEIQAYEPKRPGTANSKICGAVGLDGMYNKLMGKAQSDHADAVGLKKFEIYFEGLCAHIQGIAQGASK